MFFTGALDDEVAVKIREAYGHILHAKPFADVSKYTRAIDGKAKTSRVDVRSAHAGINNCALAGGDGKSIKRDGPRAVGGFNLVSPGKTARNEIGARLGAELLPD